ncbi:hypothetical protein SAMN05519104_6399 [Rhizobiales bacterium GAS188]|nr:hypothetical protein SAMN05519104_6399 [Rhizobiales bacterium GAS188]
MWLPAILWSKAMDTRMSRSEKIVAGLAVAVLVAGFATGVFAKPVHNSAHNSVIVTQVVPTKAP